jgi:hypothetical protein
MKKVLTAVAGAVALVITGACSPAVDTKETTSTTPIAASERPQTMMDTQRRERISRDAARPKATPVVSHHENHINHAKIVKAAAVDKAAKVKAKKLTQKPKPKKKIVKIEKTVKPKKKAVKAKKVAKPKTKKVGLSGIAACIAKYESGGNPRAQNPHSSASGLFQFVDGTWRAITGRSDRAKDAPVSVQIAAFYKLWNNGKGAHHWVVSPKCGY